MPNNQIISVTSDKIDPSTLDTTSPTASPLPVAIYAINGMANVDPLQMPNAAAPINEHSALCHPAYFSGVKFIAETVAGLPKHVIQRTPTGPQRLHDHPEEWTLNAEPNPLQTPSVFFSTFMVHAVNWSNAFAALKQIPGQDTEMYLLPPDRMKAFRFNGKQFYVYDTETPTDPDNPNSNWIVFGADEIIHLPALSFNGMTGLPMVKMMAGTFRTAKNTEQYVSTYYGQGGLMMGVLESDQPLTQEQVNFYSDTITNKFSGADKAHRWMTVGHNLKARNLANNLDTGQVVENRQFSVIEFCRMLRLPPHILYELGRATWANLESLGREVVIYSLMAWVKPLEQELTRKLLTRAERKAGTIIKFDFSDLTRGDTATQVEIATKRVMNGLTTPDEERAIWELPPYADGIGSRPRVPANTVGLGDAAAAPALPATPPVQDEDTEDLKKKDDGERFTVKRHLKLSHFSEMLMDAAKRVHAKTDKATEAAQKKHANNPQGWIAFSNVFSEEMGAYATTALAPVFTTYSNLSGKDTTGMAAACGREYARGLAMHLSKLGKKEDTTPPDLYKIAIDKEYDDDTDTDDEE
jgi:HK97 family phage portal protein